MNDAAFLYHDRAGVDVTGDDGARLQLDARRRGHIALHGATNDHLARRDVADNRGAGANDDDVGATDRAVETAVHAQRTIGLDVAANGELRVEHRIAGARRGKIGRIWSAFENAQRRSRAVKGEAMKLRRRNRKATRASSFDVATGRRVALCSEDDHACG